MVPSKRSCLKCLIATVTVVSVATLSGVLYWHFFVADDGSPPTWFLIILCLGVVHDELGLDRLDVFFSRLFRTE
jgi:hypothetical protein